MQGNLYTDKHLFFNQAQKSSAVIQTKYIATICVTAYGNGVTPVDNKQVYTSKVGSSSIFEQYYNEVTNSQRKATFYNTYNSYFVDMLSPDYDQFYGLEQE